MRKKERGREREEEEEVEEEGTREREVMNEVEAEGNKFESIHVAYCITHMLTRNVLRLLQNPSLCKAHLCLQCL